VSSSGHATTRSRVQQFLWKTLWKTSAAGGFSSANPPDLRFAPRWCDARAAPERHIIAEQKKTFPHVDRPRDAPQKLV
jgi:hypothetical protein